MQSLLTLGDTMKDLAELVLELRKMNKIFEQLKKSLDDNDIAKTLKNYDEEAKLLYKTVHLNTQELEKLNALLEKFLVMNQNQQ